jgi:hypothetical protein
LNFDVTCYWRLGKRHQKVGAGEIRGDSSAPKRDGRIAMKINHNGNATQTKSVRTLAEHTLGELYGDAVRALENITGGFCTAGLPDVDMRTLGKIIADLHAVVGRLEEIWQVAVPPEPDDVRRHS